MFDLSSISTLIMPTILVLCLCVGYIIKNLIPGDNINRFIPLILAVVGVAAGVATALTAGEAVTVELIVASMVSGCASTAVYEQFKNIMEGKTTTTTDSTEE